MINESSSSLSAAFVYRSPNSRTMASMVLAVHAKSVQTYSHLINKQLFRKKSTILESKQKSRSRSSNKVYHKAEIGKSAFPRKMSTPENGVVFVLFKWILAMQEFPTH